MILIGVGQMARKGSGLRTVIKIINAVEKSQKKAVRDEERYRKQRFRQAAKDIREQEREEKAIQKSLIADEKARAKSDKERFKLELNNAKEVYLERCIERNMLSHKFINMVIR